MLVEKGSIEFATSKDSAHRIRMPATTSRGLDATLIQPSGNRMEGYGAPGKRLANGIDPMAERMAEKTAVKIATEPLQWIVGSQGLPVP